MALFRGFNYIILKFEGPLTALFCVKLNESQNKKIKCIF